MKSTLSLVICFACLALMAFPAFSANQRGTKSPQAQQCQEKDLKRCAKQPNTYQIQQYTLGLPKKNKDGHTRKRIILRK